MYLCIANLIDHTLLFTQFVLSLVLMAPIYGARLLETLLSGKFLQAKNLESIIRISDTHVNLALFRI